MPSRVLPSIFGHEPVPMLARDSFIILYSDLTWKPCSRHTCMLLHVGYILETRAVIGGDDLRGGHRLRPKGNGRAERKIFIKVQVATPQDITFDSLGSVGIRQFASGSIVCHVRQNLLQVNAQLVCSVLRQIKRSFCLAIPKQSIGLVFNEMVCVLDRRR